MVDQTTIDDIDYAAGRVAQSHPVTVGDELRRESQPRTLLGHSDEKLDPLDEKVIGTGSDIDSLSNTHPDAPTPEEQRTLRRVPGDVPLAAFALAFIELCERFAYYGSIILLQNFVQFPRPPGSSTGAGFEDGQSGALGKGQRTATAVSLFNSFWAYTMPVVGGFLADAKLGRSGAIQWGIGIAVLGHVILTISAAPAVLDHPNAALGIFVLAILVMGVGTGFFKSNVSVAISEQVVEPLHVKTLSSGERVLVDPAVTASRVYTWFYMCINIGSVAGQVSMSFAAKYVGFWLGFLTPTALFLLCPLVLLAFKRKYVMHGATGSILPAAWNSLRIASKGRYHLNPVRTWRETVGSRSADFWNAAKPSFLRRRGEPLPSKMIWDDKFIDEFSRGLKACKIFLWYVPFWLSYNQNNNNLLSQAAVMETNGLPNEIINNLNPLSIIIFIPFFDRVIYPLCNRLGHRPTPVKKITGGFFMASLAMVYSALIQHFVYATRPCPTTGSCVAPLNVWLQGPSYVFIGIAEILASITGLEVAFNKAPKSMRSIVMGIFLFMSAFASALGQAFVGLSEDPLLVWNYGVIGVLAFLAGCGFWIQFRDLDKQEDELNDLQEGTIAAHRKDSDVETR